MVVRKLLILVAILQGCRAQTTCSQFSDCDYAGCTQTSDEGNFFGCNCQEDQVKNAYDAQMSTNCFLGNEDTPVGSGTCVYSTNFAATFAQCPPPCQTECAAGFYVNNCACVACPEGFSCNGTAPPCASQCPDGQYLEECTCKNCSDGFLCANSTAIACNAQCLENEMEASPCSALTNRICTCKSGYRRLENMSCGPCPQGFACPDELTTIECGAGVYVSEGAASCDCPGNMIFSNGKCQCPSGYYENAQLLHGSSCACAAGTINMARSCSPQLQCPTSKRGVPTPCCGLTDSNVASRGNDDNFNLNGGGMELGEATGYGDWWWWMVDFQISKNIGFVDIYQRGEEDQRALLAQFTLWIGINSSAPNATGNMNCFQDTNALGTSLPTNFRSECKGWGRYLYISQNQTRKLGFNELQVFAPSSCNNCAYSSDICQICPKGSYCKGNETNICPPGTFNDKVGQSFCILCPQGHFCMGGSHKQSCAMCPAGSQSCPAGYTCNDLLPPKPCMPGTYSLAGSSMCTSCLPGSWSNNSASTSCFSCSSGTYGAGPGFTSKESACLGSCGSAAAVVNGNCDCKTLKTNYAVVLGNCYCQAGYTKLSTSTQLGAACGANFNSRCPSDGADGGYYGHMPVGGNDGKLNTIYHSNQASNMWFRVNLESTKKINRVVYYPRQDCCQDWSNGFKIWVGPSSTYNGAGNVNCYTETRHLAGIKTIDISCVATGQYVFVHLPANQFLVVSDIEIYEVPGCVQCYNGSASSITPTCQPCLPGYKMNSDGFCELCQTGFYCPNSASEIQCSVCLSGTYQRSPCNSANDTDCVTCDPNSVSPFNASTCTCNTGYVKVGENECRWPSCIPFTDTRDALRTLNNGKCQKCYAFSGNVCGCDVLYSCGLKNKTLCGVYGEGGSLTGTPSNVYDNNQGTSYGSSIRYSTWIRYDLQYARRIVGGIVKGDDGDYDWADYFQIWVGNNANDALSNTQAYGDGWSGLQYSQNIGFFTIDVIGRYVFVYRSYSSRNKNFRVTEFRVFEFGNMPYDNGKCSSCGSNDTLIGSTCTKCPDGTYFDNVRWQCSQLICDEGLYTINGTSAGCRLCTAGYYCPNATVETLCPITTFSSQGQASCTLCPPGTINPDNIGLSQCRPCRAGYYCPNATTELLCPAATYSGLAQSNCTACPPTTYNPEVGQPTCFPCPPTTTSTAGALRCVCSPGFLRIPNSDPPPQNVTCLPCEVSNFCPDNATQIPCPLGSFSTANATTCTWCRPGNYCPNTSTELQCAAPSYSTQGSTSCTESRCAINTYSFSGTCQNCPLGGSAALSSSRTACSTSFPCIPINGVCSCDLAYTCGANMNLRCTINAQGYRYPNDFGNVDHYALIDGNSNRFMLGDAGNTYAQLILNRPTQVTGILVQEHPGYPGASVGQTFWVGNNTVTPGCTTQATCVPNSVQCTYVTTWGQTCPIGQICRYFVCPSNAVGKYVTLYGNGYTSQMRPYGLSNMIQPSCNACPGKTLFSGYSCNACYDGQYNVSGECLSCPRGMLCDGEFKRDCLANHYCPNGTHAVKCSVCTYEYYASSSCNATDNVVCTPCPNFTATIVSAVNASQCVRCLPGYTGTSEVSCRPCTAGFQCPIPSVMASPMSFTETICAPGSFSPAVATSCTTCPANTYSDIFGSSMCLACQVNSLSPAGSSTRSACNCNNGYYRNIDFICVLCPMGFYCTNNVMTPCALGTFSGALGAGACSLCGQGKYMELTGASACSTCPAGETTLLENTNNDGVAMVDRTSFSDTQNSIYIMMQYLKYGTDWDNAGQIDFNVTKFSFYARRACTITPVVLSSPGGATGNQPYDNYANLQVIKQGTTRTVTIPGAYTFDFEEGKVYKPPARNIGGGGYTYFLPFFGWYFKGQSCIPFTAQTPLPSHTKHDLLVRIHPFNESLPLSDQIYGGETPNNPRMHNRYSMAPTRSILIPQFSTSITGAKSIWNCTCGSLLRTLSDGSCQGLCADGKYMFRETDNYCSTCPQGTFCVKSVLKPCPTQTSSLPGSGFCTACVGPDTHSNISQAMCGLRTCPKATTQTIPGTLWRGLGRFKVGRGGDGEVPSTHWYSGYRCMGMVLNASADRPVAILEQTLTVVPLKTYALRFKKACTGQQCSAAFFVSVSGSLLYGVSTVARTWMESGTPYFASASGNITVQFYAQMTTLSCTIWIGSLELVDMSGWEIASFTTLQLKTGVSFPVRYSPTYVFSVPHITLQIVSGGYIQQTATVLANQRYELTMWAQGSVVAEYLNGTLAPMTPTPAYDTFPGWTQVVFRVDTTSTTLTVRISGVCLITPPTLKVYALPTSRPCLECLPGYWCSSATINICPLNTISNASSYIQTDCFCKPGYYGRVELGVAYGYSPCTTCPANYYCNGGNQLSPCPAGTKSEAGSALDGCLPCPPEEFCGGGIVGNCPANSIPRPGAIDLSDCVCNPGFYGQAGNCSRCEVGFYCVGGVARVACTANAVSPMGSTAAAQCFCDRGYYGVNNSACVICPEGSWCWTGILNSCPANMWSPLRSSFQIECVCQYGYTGPNGGPCTACGTGQYKNTRGTDSCSLCTPGTSSAATGATSFLACASCNRGSYTPYTGQSSCIPCAAGDYADAYGSTVCLPCNVGYWSTQGFGTCQACPAGTFTNVTRTNAEAACVFCDPGHYSAAASTACSVCGACSYWTWPQRIVLRHLSAPVSFSSSIGAADRTQLAYYTATNALASSGSDVYLLSLSSGAATLQTLNTKQTTFTITHMFTSNDRTAVYTVQDQVYRYSLQSANYLTYLQLFYTTSAPTGAVEGLNGQHVWVFAGTMMQRFLVTEGDIISVNYPSAFTTAVLANGCVHTSYPDYIFVAGKPAGGTAQWGFRKYQLSTQQWQIQTLNLTSTRKCFFTPDGYFVFLTTDTQVYYYSMTEDTMTLFYTGQVNNIYFDPGSSYVLLSLQSQRVDKVPFIIEDARNCGPGKYSLSGGLAAESLCETCPAGNVCPSGASITPCKPGTYSALTGMRSQGQCTLCPPGSYCTGGTSLQLCPLGSYSIMSGLSMLADCPLCPAGFYCTNTTDIAPCPANTMSPSGSSDLASCSCNAGYRCEVTQVVHAEVELPITIDDFEAMRAQYIAAVAAAAGVDSSQVLIVSVTNAVLSVRRRHLLQQPNWVQVHTSIYNSKFTEKPHLALVNLQRQLVARGLPPHEPNIRITLHREVQKATRALSMRGA